MWDDWLAIREKWNLERIWEVFYEKKKLQN